MVGSWVFMWFLVLLSTNCAYSFISRPALKSGSCQYSVISSMKTYDCVGLNLYEVPTNLQSSVEVFDLSINRIRELTNSSFTRYTSIKQLYINDNMIMTIESGTFDRLTNLDTLDMSMNALLEVPTAIFHLPSLRHLMLSKNLRLDILSLISKAAPITAPIQYLDISYSPLLNQLPNFGVFMDLVHLNVSGNNVTNVSVNIFVGLCNLKYFSGENLTMEFSNECECERINNWFLDVNVKTNIPFSHRCLAGRDDCYMDMDSREEDSFRTIHDKCRTEFQARENYRSIFRICYIALAVIGGVLGVVLVCYVYHRTQKLPPPKEKKLDNSDVKEEPLLSNNNFQI